MQLKKKKQNRNDDDIISATYLLGRRQGFSRDWKQRTNKATETIYLTRVDTKILVVLLILFILKKQIKG